MHNTSIIVHGASGRLGSRICAAAQSDPAFTLAGALVRAGSPSLGAPAASADAGKSTVKHTLFEHQRADVVIDVSSDEGAREAARIAREAGAALLVATTALSPTTLAALRELSTTNSVLIAPNTSLGVAVLAAAIARAARALGPGFDVSIVEAHHNKKKDAPSGTALRLAAALGSAGATIARDQIVAMRGGDVIGEHTVRFAGQGEYLEFTHRATSRDVFSLGALRAASWLSGRAPGWYTMEDVLGLTAS